MTLLIGSSNASVGMTDGMAILRDGGSAIDAVVATIRRVEANPDDHSVGYGGLPNLLGEVELDASIMDGRTLASGAVAALRDHQDAIDLARTVMEDLPHVLIVGDGARLLASETGMPGRDLLTPEAEAIWRSRMADAGYRHLPAQDARACQPHEPRPRAPAGRPRHRQRHRSRPRTAPSPAASAPPVGPGNSPAASATPPSSAPATTPTTAGAPPPAPAAVRWRSDSAPPTAS